MNTGSALVQHVHHLVQ